MAWLISPLHGGGGGCGGMRAWACPAFENGLGRRCAPGLFGGLAQCSPCKFLDACRLCGDLLHVGVTDSSLVFRCISAAHHI